MYIEMYIERERVKEREKHICIYRHRERDSAGSLHDDIVSANFVNRGNTSHDMSLNSDKQNKNDTET